MPAAPYPCAAPCSVPSPQQPNKGSIIFSLSREDGGGGRNEIKVLAVEMVNPGAGNRRGSWGAGRKGMRAVGDTQHCLPGQSAVQALIFVDIYTLRSHSPLCSRNGESPAPAAPNVTQREGENRLEDASGTKQPPVQLGTVLGDGAAAFCQAHSSRRAICGVSA